METRKCTDCEAIIPIDKCDFECEITSDNKVMINAICPNCGEPLWFAFKPLSEFHEDGM